MGITRIRGNNATSLQAVTPSDTNTIYGCTSLYVGGAGNVAVVASGDTAAVTFVAVPAGTMLRVEALKVMATNTTATNIVAMKA